MGTVSGIIDGTGSVGSAIGQFVIGWLQSKTWKGVFIMLDCLVLCAVFPLLGVFCRDVREIRRLCRERSKDKTMDHDSKVHLFNEEYNE